MASVNKLTIFSGAISGVGATNAVQLEALATDIIAVNVCSALSANNFHSYLEHSPDGTNWFRIGELEKQGGGHLTTTGAAIYKMPNTIGIMGAIRIAYDVSGGLATATVSFDVRYDKRR